MLEGSAAVAALACALIALALLVIRADGTPRWPRAQRLLAAGVCGLAAALTAGSVLHPGGTGAAQVVGLALAAWLCAAAAQLGCLARRHWHGSAVALAVLALQAMLVGGAWAYALVGRSVFGEWPGRELGLGMPVLVAVSVLTLGLAALSWHHARQTLLHGEQVYRWAFARHLAWLLACTLLSGLGSAAVVAQVAASALTDGLLARAELRAEALRSELMHTAQSVLLALREHELVGADGGLLPHDARRATAGLAAARHALAALGEPELELRHAAADTADRAHGADDVLPVFTSPSSRIGLLADGTLQLDVPGPDRARMLRIRLRPRRSDGAGGLTPPPRSPHADRLPARPWLCAPAGPRLRCLGLADADEPATAAPVWTALPLPPPGTGHAIALWAHGPQGERGLNALAPLGNAGALLVLQVGAEPLFEAAGQPILVALAGVALLALLAAAWTVRHDLPELRRGIVEQARAQAMSTHLPLALLLVGDDGRVLAANLAAAELFGRPAAALNGQPARLLLPVGGESLPDSPGGLWQARHAELGTIPVEARVSVLQRGRGTAAVVALRDLREELRTRAELQRWHHVFQQAGWAIAIVSVGDSPCFELANAAYGALVGRPVSDLPGRPVSEVVAPSQLPAQRAMRAQAAASGHCRGELRHRRADGSEFPTLVDMSAVRGPDGAIAYYVVSVLDITDMRQTEQHMREMASQLGAVLDALPVGVWISDAEGTVSRTNPAAAQLWLGAAGDAPPARWWDSPHPRRADHASLMRRAAATLRRTDGGAFELEVDGARRTLLTSASPIVGEDGRALGAVAVDEDVTAMRQREQALRLATTRLERILDAGAVAMAVCEASGAIQRTNVAWYAMLGRRPAGAAAAPGLDDLLDPDDPLRQRQLVRRICEVGLPTYVGEHRLRRVAGDHFWAMVVVSRLPGAGRDEPSQALLQVIDIDARRQAVEQLATSQARLAAAQRVAGMGDWIWHLDTDVLECSDELLYLLGIDAPPGGTLPRQALLQRVHPDDRDRLAAQLDAARQAQGRLDADCRMRRSDGSLLEVHVQGVAQAGTERPVMLGTLQDVSERKRIESELRQSQERLRELATHEAQVIEEERKRIAREVHDELGQLLTALRMDIGMLRGLGGAPPELADRLERMRSTASRMSEVVRHVASHLRPAALDHGLVAAVEWLAEDFSLRWERPCRFDPPDGAEPELPEAVSLALFRAVQESLTNIARHAEASQVHITLAVQHDELRLTVRDDGRGFDVSGVTGQAKGGLGLLGMRERMRAIGAQLELRSGGSGTTISITYPMQLPVHHA